MDIVSDGKAFSMRTMHKTGGTITHILSVLVHINDVSASMCMTRSFDRTISSAKMPRRQNVSGIPKRDASSSTAKCSSQDNGSHVVPT
ncbi:hypothetical protein TNIN_242651 [Trichonephila inaurata madagascariensis]|uniref:Uncharacterized protein n=1 Tax=Trichonephila inaurata madagascariensis TaxID=2747483 RepID=A0A8X7C7V1_9ARAC|nr:hypothetical protein TNIN_242651 [Trichonephila inaurata madagascariensis]